MKTPAPMTRPVARTGLFVALALAFTPGAVLAQDSSAGDITHDLNSGPPVAIATPPPPIPQPRPEPRPAAEVPAGADRSDPEPAPTPAPSQATSETPAAVAEPTPPSTPEPAALTLAERRALSFRVDLPEGAGIYPGRSGPEFDIFSIRRQGRGLLMIYVGPQSQFPIYSGEQRERAGRKSIVVHEGERTLALEHLYRLRGGAELHVWVSAVSDEDRALADAIGHTVEPR